MDDTIPRVTSVVNDGPPKQITLRCPHCGKLGSLLALKGNDYAWQRTVQQSPNAKVATNYVASVRRCPADDCCGLVFIVTRDGKLLTSYPAETIDFDSTQLPERIKASLEEAIKAHAALCHKAAALMVRRTLEEVCSDRQAKGDNLKERLAALRSQTLIPKELMDAADEIRLLGNDAAHIEAKIYDQIGKDEVEVAIELTKEILKGVYQYSALLQRLKGLKKPAQP